MCGRYTLRRPGKVVADTFDAPSDLDWQPRYNIAPTQSLFAIRHGETGRACALLRWGLVPNWADEPSIGVRMLNARADTVAQKPAYRAAFAKRRCLIAADGFFEWLTEGKKKQPFLFRMHDERVFAFAGIWETWERQGQRIESASILTTEANDVVRDIHDRMPVILPAEALAIWLAPATAPEALHALLRPYSGHDLLRVAVDPVVGNVRNEGPQCVAPVAQPTLF